MKGDIKEKEKIDILEALADACIYFSKEADEILNYYFLSKAAIKQDYAKKKSAIPESYAIMELFNSVYKAKSNEERNEKITEIKASIINDKYRLSDIFSDLSYDENTSLLSYSFKERKFNKYNPTKARYLDREYGHMMMAAKTSMLSNAIITYEKFLANLYKQLIYCDPCLYFEAKTVLVQELLSNNLNDLLDNKTDELVEADMYDSLELTKKIFEKERINTEKVMEVLKRFEETYYRRNIYVHNGGEVNGTYLFKVKTSKNKVGDFLSCSDEYFSNAITDIKCLITFITFSIILKVGYDDDGIDSLIDYYFSELKDKKYDFTKYAYSLLSSNKKCPLCYRMIYEVNYLISLKGLSDSEFKKELATFDVSASDDKFKIAKAVFEEDYQKAHDLIEDNYETEQTPFQLADWPLYEDFRKTDYYNQIVINHQTDFNNLKEVDSK